jgi:hypothetical protein
MSSEDLEIHLFWSIFVIMVDLVACFWSSLPSHVRIEVLMSGYK